MRILHWILQERLPALISTHFLLFLSLLLLLLYQVFYMDLHDFVLIRLLIESVLDPTAEVDLQVVHEVSVAIFLGFWCRTLLSNLLRALLPMHDWLPPLLELSHGIRLTNTLLLLLAWSTLHVLSSWWDTSFGICLLLDLLLLGPHTI